MLPRLRLALPEGDGDRIDIANLFRVPRKELWLEIGFGGGEHLAYQVWSSPSVGLIGCEPFVPGVSRLLGHLEADGTIDRVRIVPDDARHLIECLPDACVDRLFVLFPDPWPKKRHHKRRLISRDTLGSFARVMRDGAELRLASDDPSYVRWILGHFIAADTFSWCAERAHDWRVRPEDWPATRYEEKAIAAGRNPVFLRFVRNRRLLCGVSRAAGETP
jgi:tRNA (guanine-N7-)-methyltransferase